jgi:hypothetical protein
MKPLGGGLLERTDLCFGFLQQYQEVVPIPGIRVKKEADEIIGLYAYPKRLSKLHPVLPNQVLPALSFPGPPPPVETNSQTSYPDLANALSIDNAEITLS